MADYYDWQKTLSYDADATMVIGARGIGKTFGIRKQCINDFLKDGSRFCEIVRYRNEIYDVAKDYFGRLSKLPEFSGYEFKSDTRYAYIAEKPEEGQKARWQLAGYFVALTEGQKLKKKTFDKVRRMIFDEAVIDRNDRYHRYLPHEYMVLADMVDTVSRERADTKSLRPRIYLLGNACDISNPYFAAYGVGTDLRFGYRWYAGKTMLLHYCDPGEYAQEKASGTVAGRMFSNTNEGKVSVSNEFIHLDSSFIKKKPKRAKFSFGIRLNGKDYGIWMDESEGMYYVARKIPANTPKPVFALTRADNTINLIAANRADAAMKYVESMYYYGLLRYENETVMNDFGEVLSIFGIR